MEKFIKHTGSALPLRRSNVDTDQIIPAVYLKRITKSGFEDGLFAAWRNDPTFVLNQPQHKNATVLSLAIVLITRGVSSVVPVGLTSLIVFNFVLLNARGT